MWVTEGRTNEDTGAVYDVEKIGVLGEDVLSLRVPWKEIPMTLIIYLFTTPSRDPADVSNTLGDVLLLTPENKFFITRCVVSSFGSYPRKIRVPGHADVSTVSVLGRDRVEFCVIRVWSGDWSNSLKKDSESKRLTFYLDFYPGWNPERILLNCSIMGIHGPYCF